MANEHPALVGTYLGVSQLKDRGWTRVLISTFLGEPDLARRGASGGRPAGLFDRRRVMLAESSLAFQRALGASRHKAASAQVAATSRKVDVLRYAEKLELQPPPWTFDELIGLATRSLAIRLFVAGQESAVWSRALSLALESFGEADARLDLYQRSAGIREARVRLRQRKLAVIASRYPALGSLCRTQSNEGNTHYAIPKAA